MSNQTTIKRPVSLTGTSITGDDGAFVSFCPAPPNTGIVFIRTDLPGRPKVKGKEKPNSSGVYLGRGPGVHRWDLFKP
mgnify:CR=1 FL=1